MGAEFFGSKMIDWQRIEDLRNEIGATDFSEVAALFLEEADEVVARLPLAKTARAIEGDLHFLKGSALNLGFTELAQMCQLGEQRAAAGETDTQAAQVQSVYARSRRAFLARLADEAG